MFRLLIALSMLAGCSCDDPKPAEPAESVESVEAEPVAAPPADGTLAWSEALAALDERLPIHAARQDATHQGLAAEIRLSRARLTGSYDDYAAAEQHVDAAFSTSPEGAGPFLTRAALNYSLHRLDRVEADLDAAAGAVLVDKPTQARIALARGKLRFHQGRYAEARALVQEALTLRPVPQPNALATLALIHWRTGDLELADGLYADALEGQSDQPSEPRAWLHLQLGLLDLDRGRYAEALAHYEDAGRVLSGWYLVDEHIAEIYVLTGREAEARSIYERVAESTKSPEFYDALAGLADDPTPWVGLARAAYEAQLQRFPEAAYGHALGHYLDFGPPERALELAQRNVGVRPYGGAWTGLVEAKVAMKDASAAEDADALLAQGWRSADAHAAAAEAYALAGRAADAEAQRAAALALNPRIFD